jgi:prepilin-type N-terminal cleavage/methylation domain-containing protein
MEKKYFHGFTLIEVLLVVSIIVILALLAINTFLGQISKGNDSRRKADLNRIKIALEDYEKDYNCYPLVKDMQTCGSNTSVAIAPYLNKVPCDPQTNIAYVYENDGTSCPKWFRIYSLLQNVKDLARIPNIGPGSAYNYYVSSDNIPALGPGTASVQYYWGCIGGQCVSVSLKPDGSGPVCQPGFTNDFCNTPGNCGTPSHPLNECI